MRIPASAWFTCCALLETILAGVGAVTGDVDAIVMACLAICFAVLSLAATVRERREQVSVHVASPTINVAKWPDEQELERILAKYARQP
jgi:hypothetical protein